MSLVVRHTSLVGKLPLGGLMWLLAALAAELQLARDELAARDATLSEVRGELERVRESTRAECEAEVAPLRAELENLRAEKVAAAAAAKAAVLREIANDSNGRQWRKGERVQYKVRSMNTRAVDFWVDATVAEVNQAAGDARIRVSYTEKENVEAETSPWVRASDVGRIRLPVEPVEVEGEAEHAEPEVAHVKKSGPAVRLSLLR
jgi:ribosomal protein L29